MEQAAHGAAVDPRIAAYLAGSGLSRRHPQVTPMTGDASDRRYFRVRLDDGASLVLALHVGPIHFATMPFASVARLLQRMHVPAPAILDHSDELGIIVQEDLGDTTLRARIGPDAISRHMDLYRGAVRLICTLQQGGARHSGQGFAPYTLAFDVEKLTFELNFFVMHFLEAFRGITLSSAERTTLETEFRTIVVELAGERRVLCHRDYHSRNLMVRDDALYLIDFQDARMGPDTYDLASLLRDSYVDITSAELDELLAWFRQEASVADAVEFRRRFDLMSVQRNLKALGTFGFQTMSRGATGYLESIPRTLRYVRENLRKYSRFTRLHELLAAHVDELR